MPPPVTFNIDPSSKKSSAERMSKRADLANEAAVETESSNWQRGRKERIRRLEAALDATTRLRQQQQQQQRRHNVDTDVDANTCYGDMLESEDEDGDAEINRSRDGLLSRSSKVNSDSDSSDNNEDARSETSSLFYNEGQPLLCTYYQPPAAPTAAGTNGSTVFGRYGSITASNPPPKTPEQYLPWSVRFLDTLHNIGLNSRFLCSGCCQNKNDIIINNNDSAHSVS
ncbi:hypothetical protein J3B02_001625 [Coemansia erecta]|nr:hypothetical protein J3B02_001625 [Coemansia erecta]